MSATPASPWTLRPLATREEYHACVRLQEEVWGEGFQERVPAALLMVANRLGGLAAGAFSSDGALEGFVFGLTGLVGGEPVHWSDMLAVRPEERNRGLGTRLKLFQREVLLARGVRRMHWTFDPLQARNAHINFTKLGAVCREYAVDLYGETGSPLHRGIGTDRMVVTWEMDSPRVVARVEGDPVAMPSSGGTGPGGGGIGAPLTGEGQDTRARAHLTPKGEPTGLATTAVPVVPWELPGGEGQGLPSPTGSPLLGLNDPRLFLPIPTRIEVLMEADLPLAVRWRQVTREALIHYLGRGYEVREFFRGEPVSHYLLVAPGVEP